MNTKQADKQYIANIYKRNDLTIVKGKGARVWDDTGREYIEFTSGIGVNSFGVADEKWLEAVALQAGKIQHISGYFYTEPCAKLAQLLCEKSGFTNVCFMNSGAEANETAIKAARKYSSDKYGENRGVVVSLEQSFHGRTHATITATGQDDFHKHFYPFPQGYVTVPANDIAALQKALDENPVCAFLFECIQGEGGVIAMEKEYLQAAQKLCQERDILCIADEVQTGNGRLGTLYAWEQFGIERPDILTTAKGLGGGLPIGAALFSEKTANVLGYGTHGSTYGGNPVVCAGAISVVERLTPEFLSSVNEKGDYIRAALGKMSHVTGLYGAGLMIGITTDLSLDSHALADKCREEGLLALTAKEKLRLLPPLNVSYEDIDSAIEVLRRVLG